MLLKLCIFGLILVSSTLADKPSSAPEDILKEDLKAKITTVVKDLKQVADERSDTIAEKSDIVDAAAASSSNYEAGAPVSQGNLYYYYYPVAAYPVHSNGHGGHASDKVSSGSSSALGGDLLESPLVFILVPLVLLLIAAPLVALYGGSSVSTSRSFGSRRSANLDDKFGSFDEFQDAIDMQLMKYTAALDSERCMDRIVCELGVRASNIPHKNLFFSVVEWLAPEHGLLGYGRMAILKKAASGVSTMETCKKYRCNPPPSVQYN